MVKENNFIDEEPAVFDLELSKIENVIIGKNSLRYRGQFIKISNISRTWIYTYRNKDREAYEKEIMGYKKDKMQYEESQRLKEISLKSKKTKALVFLAITTLIFLIITIFLFNSVIEATVLKGLICALITVGLLYAIYKKHNENIEINKEYYIQPPQEYVFPETYGLSIETNSQFSLSISSKNIEFLRKIERYIHNADIIHVKNNYNFNLCDNSVNVETVETIDFTINEGEIDNG